MSDRPDLAEVVAASWRTVLDVTEVHDDDDFFELGGNSIMVTRIVSYLRRELGVEVDMLQVWDTPTFGDFRAAVEKAAGAQAH
ncbi:phosphopantetheine-binding protein [Saccharomonospora sp. NB11]|uniref:phosphopantetheine-binding protein n=1 Tax=Saccharomonospora sp. NB11 TaxID=1642298 RepID=UPI0018D1339A|nr:phosphopantetheine-binding protein [Saccharomonospora sp. NB11]